MTKETRLEVWRWTVMLSPVVFLMIALVALLADILSNLIHLAFR